MERLHFEFPAGQPAASPAVTCAVTRVVTGVVASGDLEVLLAPQGGALTTIAVQTSVDGYGGTWKALLERVFADATLPAASIEINDNGATPGVVRMRIEQAFEEAQAAGGQP
ncbi:UNVERIFIED_ORG: malonate decarboxylase delta subunit [Zoogloea ramigera]|uniref:Malonate decarboxylase acyl carrier protein n=1 Tax=Duganella zoogloeoides TaxID=75659 RepID=A0ABZ0Y5N0_9BURK|nr:malonate decarboxylase subunit delta [Duganella zoogloeoides]WQH07133.1 malonate decarboxylase subunit delta [Duganella zoogloeoides]